MMTNRLLSRRVISSRRFPPPWTVEETDACFMVKDRAGQSLAPMSISRKSPAGERRAKLLTRDEARRIAVNIAKLPTLVTKGGSNGTR
jgi:hypothetical protein